MQVYDCFTFYNEFELLELRFKSLWDVVDYFVIVEANRKHNGESKDFNLLNRMDDFKEFSSKIKYVSIELSNMSFKGVGDWSIENAQRNAIIYGLNDAEPDDLIMISDLDEIPAPDIFRRLHENEVTLIAPQISLPLIDKPVDCLAQLLMPAIDFLEVSPIVMENTLHYYFLDWISREIWLGTTLTKRKNLTTPQQLRESRNRFPLALNGGYHFSYMGGIDRVIDKMTSIVDGNGLVIQSGGKVINRAHVEKSMMTGTDVYCRQGIPESQFIPYDVHKINLPHLNEFLRKYPHFLREPEKYFGI